MSLANLLKSLIFIGLIWQRVQATTYLPIPLEKQFAEADGVIEGKFIGEISKRLPNGDVVTQATFTTVKSAGLLENEIVNPSDFKVFYPGGKWNGVVYHVYGSPKFEVGQDYIVLLKKQDFGYFTSNLSLGKYDLKTKDGEKFVISSVFPDHPKIGKTNYLKFNLLVKKSFGSELSFERSEQTVTQAEPENVFTDESEDKKERVPASMSQVEAIENNKSVIFWHAITLSTLGILVALYRKMDRKKR